MLEPTYQFTETVVALTGDENTGTNGTSSNYVLFGDWPKTIAAGDITFRSEPESNGYYVGSDGNYYAKCLENAYGTGTEYKYTNGVQAKQSSSNSYAYFKVEPIKWRVLDTAFDYDGTSGSNTAKLLLAEDILTANVSYYESYSTHRNGSYVNNYMHSQIRAYLNGISYNAASSSDENKWLNKGFLQSAFSTSAQNLIKTTVVDNSAASTTDVSGKVSKADGTVIKSGTVEGGDAVYYPDYTCDNTNDKIFLLSEYEVTKYSKEAYDASGAGNTRIRKPTDYAKANYAYQGSTTGYGGYWWLRSPYYYGSYYARYVLSDGNANDRNFVPYTKDGVVPALSISF